jgi:hypothetical protein
MHASAFPNLRDSRGVVYVEFVFAFMPLFVMFLAICQLSLLTIGRLVVQHAALCGARAAIVVLEDDPKDYADAPRGNLDDGEATRGGIESMLQQFGLAQVAPSPDVPATSGVFGPRLSDRSGEQRGARMVSIRAAGTMPLLLLAPNESTITKGGSSSLGGSLPADFISRLPFSLEYTALAAAITVHTAPGTDELTPRNIPRDAQITVRVTYVMPCGVPLVSALMCRTLASLIEPPTDATSTARKGESAFAGRLRHAGGVHALNDLVSPTARFAILNAETTLPNQGAAYDHKGDS